MLVDEFLDAIARGPRELISTPANPTQAEHTVVAEVAELLANDDRDDWLARLLRIAQCGLDVFDEADDLVVELANAYAMHQLSELIDRGAL